MPSNVTNILFRSLYKTQTRICWNITLKCFKKTDKEQMDFKDYINIFPRKSLGGKNKIGKVS